MYKNDIAGLKIDALTKQELLTALLSRIAVNQKTWVTTVYSEFLYAGLKDPEVMKMLNQADIAAVDGIGIFWAQKFLSLPLLAKNFWLKIIESYWQVFGTLLSLPFQKHATIPGSELIWDIAEMAAKNNFSIYLLGGFGDTAKLASEKLKVKSEKLRIAGSSNKNPNDASVIADINNPRPDILLVAYGPIKQEKWIYKHRNDLPSVKLFVGLGGTFDYVAGKRINPPSWIRQIGLEWLWRLFTQPHRIGRIWNATFGLIDLLVHYKVFASCPLRKNVAAIILNKNNRVLICQRDPKNHHVDIIHTAETLGSQNYWQLPQGGGDANENLVIAAKREAMEETGLKGLELIKISSHTHTYIWNNALRRFWKNRRHKNKGQTQNIVYLKYAGDDSNVKIDNDEFINYRWITIQDLEKTIHTERLPLTKIVTTDIGQGLIKPQ